MNFEKNIKEWVALDNQEKKLKDRVKDIRSTKNNITDKILVYTEENNLGHATIEISDGKLKFQNTKITSPLTFKFLEKCLNECIENREEEEEDYADVSDYPKTFETSVCGLAIAVTACHRQAIFCICCVGG